MNDEIELNERVTAIVCFGSTKPSCKLIKFIRPNNQEIKVTDTGLIFPINENNKNIKYVFDVASNEADYRLVFNVSDMTWRLVRISERSI